MRHNSSTPCAHTLYIYTVFMLVHCDAGDNLYILQGEGSLGDSQMVRRVNEWRAEWASKLVVQQ